MGHKKYSDIIRLGHPSTRGILKPGDKISVTEKIDGANASFIYDEEMLIGICCFSRNTKLSESQSLGGFYHWVEERITPIKEKLNKDYRYFGEWLIPHKVQYKEAAYKKFYLFSIWDEKTQQYLHDDIVKSEALRLNITTPQYFYEGEYISFEHLQSMIGKSDITKISNTGEGIVVKNTNYKDRFAKQVFVKLVSDAFAEVQKQKLPKNPSSNDDLNKLALTILTENRVEKIILKYIDDGILPQEFNIEDTGIILKTISSEVIGDCLKEEKEAFTNLEEKTVKKTIGSLIPMMVKNIIKRKQNELL